MIYTFYSYKGGVGRSMALANIAECLYRRGARVLMIDWDLEAPGLENFFFDSQEKLQDVRSQLGVIDMLLHYKRQYSLASASSAETASTQDPMQGRRVFETVKPHLLSLESLLYPIHPPARPDDKKARALWLLPPGWRSTAGSSTVATSQPRHDDRFSKYAEAVQSFDWADFYANYEGEAFFNWFCAQLLPVFQSSAATTVEHENRIGIDAVLIDSRTGVTEMGGVCTRQLSDVIVSFCAPNFQNLDGVARMTESFQREELRTFRGGRLPEVVVVPARVDEQGETDAENEFRDLFERRLATPLTLEQFGVKMSSLLIPYIVKYAFRERLTVGAPDSNRKLEKAYSDLTTSLLLFSEPESNLRTYFAPDLLQLQRSTGKTGLEQEGSPAQELVLKATSAFASLTQTEQSAAKRMLERLVTVAPEGGLDTRLRTKLSDLSFLDRSLAKRLADAQVLTISTDFKTMEEMVEIASDAFILHWPQLRRWLQEDRQFLLWRQSLNTGLGTWERSGRNKRTLLPKDQSLIAAEWLKGRPNDLNDLEREFIESSSLTLFARLRQALEKTPPELFLLAGTLLLFVLVAGLIILKFGSGRNSMNFLYGFGGGLLMTMFDFYTYVLYRGPSSQRTSTRSAVSNVLFALVGGAAARGFQTECAQMTPLLAVYVGAAAPLLIRQFISIAPATSEYKSSEYKSPK